VSDIFISYSSADRSRVRPLVDALTRRGWSVWWDRTILPGKNWDKVIEDEIASARCVIVLWSRNSIESDWVRTEAEEGKRRGILVPALIDDVAMPLSYKRIQTANLVGWEQSKASPEFDELLLAVTTILGASPVTEVTKSAAVPPPV